MANKIKTIGVLTSGGDSPGMNCAIRAVVRTAIGSGFNVVGIKRGYQGLLEGKIKKMSARSVGNIIQKGGTILETSRCPEFHQAETRKEAYNILKRNKVDALVVIGGNGSFAGAMAMYDENKLPVVGIPGTIDNDISGTDYSIGFDTAVQTAMEAVDKIRDTAASHQRTFLIEVMGRKSPAIALQVGVTTGAEMIIFPGKKINYGSIAKTIKAGQDKGKVSSIVIVAEGEKAGNAQESKHILEQDYAIKCRLCTLGHTQRGGSPTARDRFMASKMGYLAVSAFIQGKFPVVTVLQQGKVELTDMANCLKRRDEYAEAYMDLIESLSI